MAALLVLVLALPAVLFAPSTGPPVGSLLLEPLDVGIEVVWPESGFVGGPDEIAVEFARRALGWIDVETVSDPDATPDGPVWTTIQHPGREDLDVLSIPTGDGRRGLVQVGSSGVTAGPGEDGVGHVGFPRVPGASSAILHIRFAQSDQAEVLSADTSDVERGRIAVTSDSPVGAVLVVYLDVNGNGLTAAGGHFGPFGATVVEVPASHDAYRLLEGGYPTDGSLEGGPDAICAASGWQICLVQDDGILAVVVFGNPNDTAVSLEGSGLPPGPITVPADGETVVGVESEGGLVTATVLVGGEWSGELSGTLTDSDS